jgi:hypothetical protein
VRANFQRWGGFAVTSAHESSFHFRFGPDPPAGRPCRSARPIIRRELP